MTPSKPTWAVWIILGAAAGFWAGRGTIDIHKGPTPELDVLRVDLFGLTVHTEEATPDTVFVRGRIWGAFMLAATTVLGAAIAVGLRAIMYRAMSPVQPISVPGDVPRESLLEIARTVLAVSLLGAIVVVLDSSILRGLFREVEPHVGWLVLFVAVAPVTAIGILVVGQRPSPFARFVRMLVRGVVLVYLISGLIALGTLIFGSLS